MSEALFSTLATIGKLDANSATTRSTTDLNFSIEELKGISKFSRNFGELSAEVQVEKLDNNMGEIRVMALRKSRPVDGIRVTLIQDGRELHSSITEGGRTLFEGVEFGRLVVRLASGSDAIGEIGLSIMET